MTAFKLLHGGVILSVVLSLQSFLLADNGILSTAYGLRGLNWISNDPALRNKLSITEEQLTAIRNVLNDKKLFADVKPKTSDSIPFDGKLLEDQYDAIGKTHLRKILTIDQLDLLRLEAVKTRIVVPAALFEQSFLKEFELESDQVSKILGSFSEKQREISRRLDKLRIHAIKQALPSDALDVVWKFVGNEFSVVENGEDIELVSEFLRLSPAFQALRAPHTFIPNGKIEITPQQRERLRAIAKEVQRKQARRISIADEEISSELDAILSKSQRFALIQCLHLEYVRGDLLVVVNPGAARYYELSDESLAEVKAKLSESQKMIKEIEDAEVTKACSEILKEVPEPPQTKIRELIKGVWKL